MTPRPHPRQTAAGGKIKSLPSFNTWQAHLLLGRDVLFASILLLTYCLYVVKTVPAACIIGPTAESDASGGCSGVCAQTVGHAPSPAAAQEAAAAATASWSAASCCTGNTLPAQQWPLAWKFLCMQPWAADPFAWLRSAAQSDLSSGSPAQADNHAAFHEQKHGQPAASNGMEGTAPSLPPKHHNAATRSETAAAAAAQSGSPRAASKAQLLATAVVSNIRSKSRQLIGRLLGKSIAAVLLCLQV